MWGLVTHFPLHNVIWWSVISNVSFHWNLIPTLIYRSSSHNAIPLKLKCAQLFSSTPCFIHKRFRLPCLRQGVLEKTWTSQCVCSQSRKSFPQCKHISPHHSVIVIVTSVSLQVNHPSHQQSYVKKGSCLRPKEVKLSNISRKKHTFQTVQQNVVFAPLPPSSLSPFGEGLFTGDRWFWCQIT